MAVERYRPVVYVASPYTQGDPGVNTHSQLAMFDELMNDGYVWPVVPLWSHFQHLVFPRQYQDWIDYDLAMIPRYDACLRIHAHNQRLGYCVEESSGADGEVARFKELGKPVFFHKLDLYKWVNPGRKIVALTGYAGAGKDDAAAGLVEKGWTRVAFADAVRESVAATDPRIAFKSSDDRARNDGGWPLGYSPKLHELLADGGWGYAKRFSEVRVHLQRMGCEAGRSIHGDECWIRIARRKIDAAPGHVVITDLRFKNEVDAVRSWGGKVIRIDRPGVGPVNGHCSEKLEFEPDAVIENIGTTHDLQQKLIAECGEVGQFGNMVREMIGK
jgi:hypothetical protein